VHTPAETELNCVDLAIALERRWDGDLSVTEAEALDRHLAGCHHCAAKASADERLRAALLSADRSTRGLPSGAEWSRRVAAQERGFQQGRRALGIGGLSFAGAALAFGLFFRDSLPLGSRTPGQTGEITQTAVAPASLPALLVIDDEEGGRQVFQSAPRTE
jgi:anti-sigma factor RsiW